MSLLTVVQTALAELGQSVPTSVVGSTDPNAILCLSLANRVGRSLRKRVGAGDYWPDLRKQFLFNMLGYGPFTGTFTYNSPTITGVTGSNLASVLANWQVSSKAALNDTAVVSVNSGAGTVLMNQNANVTQAQGTVVDTALAFGQEAYAYPTDLDHFIPQTGWDRNFRWQLLGPVDAQEWQVLKSGISPVGPRIRYRLMGGQIYLNPSPYVPTGQSSPIADLIVMEYASKFWVAATGAPTVGVQTSYALDTDVSIITEELLILGVKWRWLRAKGVRYAEELDEYETDMNIEIGREQMARNLPMNAQASGIRLLNSQNVPDTDFGS